MLCQFVVVVVDGLVAVATVHDFSILNGLVEKGAGGDSFDS